MPIIVLMYASNFHSSKKYLLNAYCVPGSDLHALVIRAIML